VASHSASEPEIATETAAKAAADKEAKNDPNSRFLKIILFLYMSDFLNQLK